MRYFEMWLRHFLLRGVYCINGGVMNFEDCLKPVSRRKDPTKLSVALENVCRANTAEADSVVMFRVKRLLKKGKDVCDAQGEIIVSGWLTGVIWTGTRYKVVNPIRFSKWIKNKVLKKKLYLEDPLEFCMKARGSFRIDALWKANLFTRKLGRGTFTRNLPLPGESGDVIAAWQEEYAGFRKKTSGGATYYMVDMPAARLTIIQKEGLVQRYPNLKVFISRGDFNAVELEKREKIVPNFPWDLWKDAIIEADYTK